MPDERIDDVRALHKATSALVRTVARLDDLEAPSLCPGWTRGHVVTHLARNADGLAEAVAGALGGTARPVYPGDRERDAEIEAGAGRPLPELLADVERSAARLAEVLPALVPAPSGLTVERTPGGVTFPVAAIPAMRLREVVYHHVDLQAGYRFSDIDPMLVEAFLDATIARLRQHPLAPDLSVTASDSGRSWVVGGGSLGVLGPGSDLLAWLARGMGSGVVVVGHPAGTPLPAVPAGV